MKREKDPERVANLLVARALQAHDGDKLGSIRSLQEELGVGIGSVTRGVTLAVRTYTGIERRQGPSGGYFRNGPVQKVPGQEDPFAELEGILRGQASQIEEMQTLVRALRSIANANDRAEL